MEHEKAKMRYPFKVALCWSLTESPRAVNAHRYLLKCLQIAFMVRVACLHSGKLPKILRNGFDLEGKISGDVLVRRATLVLLYST